MLMINPITVLKKNYLNDRYYQVLFDHTSFWTYIHIGRYTLAIDRLVEDGVRLEISNLLRHSELSPSIMLLYDRIPM